MSNIRAKMEKNDTKNGPKGMVMPTERTGVKRTEVNKNALEVLMPDLGEFIQDQIKKERKGGYLTVQILAERATDYFRIRVTAKRMRRALNRLGYEYKRRSGKYVNRRHEAKNLAKLKEYCEWVASVVSYNEETGLYNFTIPVGFGDGANEYTKSFRQWSWILRGDPVLATCEKPRKDHRDNGTRINMLGAVYSNSHDMDSFTAWSSRETGKNPYASTEDIVNHTVAHVLPNLPEHSGAVYVLDNASNNKKVDDDLKGATCDQVHDWLIDCDPDQERLQKFWDDEASKCSTEKQTKAALFRYIRAHVDEFTILAHIVREKPGVELRYLPAYYPECNPIELVWAFIKNAYKATSVNLKWRERLDIAIAGVTEEQIEKSFDKSIRYCLDRLLELRKQEPVHGTGEVLDEGEDMVAYEEDEDMDSEDEWLNNE